MKVRSAEMKDMDFLSEYDKHVRKEELRTGIALERILVVEEEGKPVGWLRWNLFWDNTPFMNMLYLLEGYRNRGYGKALVSCWEKKMGEADFEIVMTSTLSNEEAQHFYRRLRYVDSGALLLPGEPLEIIFTKQLSGIQTNEAHGQQ